MNHIIETRKWHHSFTGYTALVVYTEIDISSDLSYYNFDVITTLGKKLISRINNISRCDPKNSFFTKLHMNIYIERTFSDWTEIFDSNISENIFISNDTFLELL